MAIYHLHCDIIGRSGGRSATAAAAYRATERIEDRTTGETFDYTKKEKALYTNIFYMPNDVPEWAKDRAELWNSCEEKENRKNSQFCRSFDIALPKELSLEDNIELVKKWVANNYVIRGLVADVAIHAPHKNADGTTNENLHAHILIPTRKLNKDGWAEKDRQANDREFLKQVRTSWAEIVNAKFESLGMSERIDERTLEAQGIDREPQQHQGAKATAMARKGKNPDRKKYRPKNTETEIEISEEELKTALENDGEIKALEAIRKQILAEQAKPKIDPDFKKWQDRISAMSPKDWADFMKGYNKNYVLEACGEYERTIRTEWNKAQEKWLENNFDGLNKYFTEWAKPKVAELKKFDKTHSKPWADAKSEKKLFRTDWYCSDGEHFGDDPIQARLHQRKLNDEYDKARNPIKAEAQKARQQWQDVQDRNFDQVRRHLQTAEHQSFTQKMIEGAKKLLESDLFKPVRAMVSAVKKLRPQKEAELEQWRSENRQKRNQGRKPDFFQTR